MKAPRRLQPLIDDGLVDAVLSRLKSGKEADIFVVRCGDEERCAKVYKDIQKRSFKQASQYQEGRKVRNSRRARAMEKGSRYGRAQEEETWHNAEMDALNRLANTPVRIPENYGCFDGVLLLELICDEDGYVAPRLIDIDLSPQQAVAQHAVLMEYVKHMLCAGLVHGDLSEFNVLVDDQGPVIIDFPQALDAAANNHAEVSLSRDVENITNFYGQFAPDLLQSRFAEEMWALYADGKLLPESVLTGEFKRAEGAVDVESVLDDIQTVIDEEDERQALESMGVHGD
ncbi:MAG: RIO kinase 1 [Parasphingorhabdus sp.]|jgi:RIO kinase 1